ncbi:hypothetical protein MUP38_01625, partial [Candidatus Bathyarchaeota archaeon]|nr:hypothetical protein [Candidatus Bathyarchaeota archaeon]
MMNLFKSAYPPPPPPPPPVTTGKRKKTGIVAAAVVAVVVILIVTLLVFNIIPWRPGTSNPTPIPTPTPTGGSGTVTYGVLIGTVVNTYGNVLSDVTVSIGGRTSATNNQGWFSVANVTAGNKQMVKFEKTGYATTYRVTNIQVGESSFVDAALCTVDKTTTFDASQGATISNTADNARLIIPALALRTPQDAVYSGMATVSMTSFDPSNELEASAFPGEYLGRSAADQTVSPIKSFGFMDVSITGQSGEQLQLVSGENATIQIPVPDSMQTEAAALSTCPLWYFDTATGIWQEEGQGTYDAASGCFVGTVNHLSTWNYDIRYPAAYVSGRVVDSNGNPVQDAQVKCWGTGWYQQRWASGETGTKADGTFQRIPVEVGVTFKYQASKGGHKSTILQAGPLTQGQEIDVGDIIIDAPVIQITLTWGLNPDDLDSHLTAKLDNNSTFHVYYDSEGSLSTAPFANLDTDDTDSYGPEVTSISRLRPGIYQYSVRHYIG